MTKKVFIGDEKIKRRESMKKRIISLILAAAMTASLAGCRGTEQAATVHSFRILAL